MYWPKTTLGRLFALSGVIVIVAGSVYFVDKLLDNRAFRIMKPIYQSAQTIDPLASPRPGSNDPKKWRYEVKLPSGETVTIEAMSFFGDAHVTYSNNQSSYVVAAGEDYIWPKELRIDSTRRYLFVLTSGLGGGIFPTTRLYQFDLIQKHRVHKATFDPKQLLNNQTAP